MYGIVNLVIPKKVNDKERKLLEGTEGNKKFQIKQYKWKIKSVFTSII